MSKHTCSTFFATCIDFRFQKFIEEWADKNIGSGEYDRVAWAGGIKDIDGVLKQLEISVRLHNVQNIVLVNHEDCGAYGEAGTPKKHAEDLKLAKDKISKLYPDLTVSLYYLHLDGTFEAV